MTFGQAFANQIRRRVPCAGDKWHLDEVVIKIAGAKHWLWRAVDQTGVALDVLMQSRRDTRAAKRLLRKWLKRQCRLPRVMITDKLASYGAAKKEIMSGVDIQDTVRMTEQVDKELWRASALRRRRGLKRPGP
jgi:putative transposase